MKNIFAICLFWSSSAIVANADVWMYVDADGGSHFVDTITPICTWADESGNHHHSDTYPGETIHTAS